MRLIYEETGKPVSGNRVNVGGYYIFVDQAQTPDKPNSKWKITFHVAGDSGDPGGPTYRCSVVGAEWIERAERVRSDRSDD